MSLVHKSVVIHRMEGVKPVSFETSKCGHGKMTRDACHYLWAKVTCPKCLRIYKKLKEKEYII